MSRPGTESSPRDAGFLPCDSVEHTGYISCVQISCRWVRRFPSNDGIKKGTIWTIYFFKFQTFNYEFSWKEDSSVPIGWSLRFLRYLRSLRCVRCVGWKPRLTSVAPHWCTRSTSKMVPGKSPGVKVTVFRSRVGIVIVLYIEVSAAGDCSMMLTLTSLYAVQH